MSEPLYLKYRPQQLTELVGQDVIARTLTNAIKLNKIAHAYFFTGPRGCGKTSTARILAKSLNCKSGPTVSPCGVCDNCREIAAGISPDVIEIDAASHRSVDDAAQVIERCHLASQTAQYKIYILDEVHMLSKEAFNALLKTIEEPPPNVVFVLATTEEHKVPATIVSRCQKFSFRPIDLAPLKARLNEVCAKENISLSEGAILHIAKQSKGGLRDALSLLDQVSILAEPGAQIEENSILELFGALSEDALKDLLSAILANDTKLVLERVNSLLEKGADSLQIIRNLIEFSIDELEREVAKGASVGSLVTVTEGLSKLEYSIRTATQSALKLKSGLLFVAAGPVQMQVQAKPAASVRAAPKPVAEIPPKTEIQAEEIIPEFMSEAKPPLREERFVPEPQPEERSESLSNVSADNEASPNGLLNILIANLPHIPTKTLLRDAKVFIISETDSSVVFGVAQKAFFTKLNEAKKVKIIKDFLQEYLGKTYDLRFELAAIPEGMQKVSSAVVAPVHSFQEVKPEIVSEPRNVVSSSVVNSSLSTENRTTAINNSVEAVDEDFEQSVFKTATHILGAKPINKSS